MEIASKNEMMLSRVTCSHQKAFCLPSWELPGSVPTRPAPRPGRQFQPVPALSLIGFSAPAILETGWLGGIALH